MPHVAALATMPSTASGTWDAVLHGLVGNPGEGGVIEDTLGPAPCVGCGDTVYVATRRADGAFYWQCMACAEKVARDSAGSPTPRLTSTRDAGDSGDSGSHPERTRWTAAELLTAKFPEPRWCIPGLIPEGLTLFVGAPKVGKSWAQLGIGVAVASGGVALGRIPVEEGDVLYLALEDRPRRLQERLRKVLAEGDPPKRLTIELACPPLAMGGSTVITDWIREHPGARLVMIDVLARVRGAPASHGQQYDADYLAVALAKQLADDHGIAVIVAHHDRKAKADDDWLDAVSGTHGLAGAADTIVVLSRTRGKADGHLRITGRDVDEAEWALTFNPLLGSWTLLEGPALEHLVSDTRAAILRYLREHAMATPKQLADALDLDHENAKKACRRMADDGQLNTDGNGYYFVRAGT